MVNGEFDEAYLNSPTYYILTLILVKCMNFSIVQNNNWSHFIREILNVFRCILWFFNHLYCFVSIWMKWNTHINNLHPEGIYMCKILCGQYLDSIRRIEVNLPLHVSREVWVSTNISVSRYLFTTFHMQLKGKLSTI